MIEIKNVDLDNSIKTTIKDHVEELLYGKYPNGVNWDNRQDALEELLTGEVLSALDKKVQDYYSIFDNTVTSALSKEDYIELCMQCD